MQRTAEQNEILTTSLDEKFASQARVMEYVSQQLQGPVVADLGCGPGKPLQFLAEANPNIRFIGIDVMSDLLSHNYARDLPNVVLLEAELTEPVPAGQKWNTAIFNRVLHEVYSTDGSSGIVDTLRATGENLPEAGKVIIYENVVQNRERVSFELLDDDTEQAVSAFMRDYSIRPLTLEKSGRVVTATLDDALEFLTKYREEDWESEMREGHFIYTQKEWDAVASDAGFALVSSRAFDDRQILRTDGIELGWHIQDFKHVMVYEKAS